MKRIRIWLKGLNLLQQFLTVGFSVVVAFVAIFYTFIYDNLDTFVNQQMYNYLHRAQFDYLQGYGDENVVYLIYSNHLGIYLSDLSASGIEEEIIDRIDEEFEGEVKDDTFDYGDRSIVYSIQKYNRNNEYSENGEYSLVAIIRNSYRAEFKTALVSGVVNVMIIILMILFLIFTLWVVSLIVPLNIIKNYLTRLKRGEKLTLHINRRDEIGEVAEALVDMKRELDRQDAIRQEMIQNISHDLKTPIATIKSYSESIKDGVYPYDNLEKSVDVIIEHADRLEKKVYSLITYNKMNYLMDNAPEGETLSMISVIQKAILACKVLRNEIRIETDLTDVSFHGDEEPWRIVVENLLDNALRYAKSVVYITLKEDLLEIYNDGDLIPDEYIDKLFKPYEKGNKGNFGLGLSIVKRVCDTYGYLVSGENMDDGVIFRIIKAQSYRKVIEKTNLK